MLLYLLHTKSLIGSADYKLDSSHLSGPTFNYKYDGGIKFSLYVSNQDELRYPSFQQGEIVALQTNNNLLEAKVIDISLNNDELYIIRYITSEDYDQVEEKYILTLDQITNITNTNDIVNSSETWIKYHAKVTFYNPN